MKLSTYNEAKTYLESLIPDPTSDFITMTLQRIVKLCEFFGDPQKKYPIIHVGGTSGKSSTATFAATILNELGLKTGLHISPHLQSLTERLQVDGIQIPETEFVDLINWAIPYVEKVELLGLGKPTYFEVLVAISFEFFARKKVDAAVIEVGLGGTFDGTNIIPPSVAILTNVSLDHTAILGKTVQKIAIDKMGIVKPGAAGIVSGLTQPSLRARIVKKTETLKIPLRLIDRDFKISTLKTQLQGEFQQLNFTLAAEAVQLLVKSYFPHKARRLTTATKRAARHAFIPGRLELIATHPRLVLDGAHNKAKMQALVNALRTSYPHQKWITVMAVKNDKSYKTLINLLKPITNRFIFTTFTLTSDMGPGLAMDPNVLHQALAKDAAVIPEAKTAIGYARAVASQTGLPILVTGSLYLVGEVRNLIRPVTHE